MEDLRATVTLLNNVFGFDPPIGLRYLEWYYQANPEGEAAVGRVDADNRQVGNYSLIPIRLLAADGRTIRLGLGVDLCVHPDARGTGTYRQTVEASYRAGATAGLDGILGVANTESAPRMVKTMGWQQLTKLPARLLLPRPGSERFTHLGVDDGLLAGGRLDELLPAPTDPPSTGHATVWNAELLRWRLARPGAHYVLHLGRDVLLVSTTTRVGPVRVAVLLKVLLRRPATGLLPSGPLAAALTAHHRTPFVLHWGANSNVHFTGPRIPRRLQPSPLELVLHRFTADGGSRIGHAGILLTSFEFLDFDAY
ncbi:MAG: hypothetical protein VYD42_03675 [Actinomycetota bacterium]|nr:hypothetical protein [Actinomycetota bacterium]